MRTKRIAISKKLRFTIFARDNFTCRYCGRQSDQVKLVIDHINPVCNGGDNVETNLVTSCDDCNAGKSGRTIEQAAPTEADRLRILQEHQEQIAINNVAIAAAKCRAEMTQLVCNQFCEIFQIESVNKQSLSVLVSFVEQYGPELVYEWMDIASNRVGHKRDVEIVKYICGIRRNYVNEINVAKLSSGSAEAKQ